MSGLQPKDFSRCKLTHSPLTTVSEDGRSRGKDWKSERMSPTLLFRRHGFAHPVYALRKHLGTPVPLDALKSLRLITNTGVGTEEVNEEGTHVAPRVFHRRPALYLVRTEQADAVANAAINIPHVRPCTPLLYPNHHSSLYSYLA
jgi:hypothetical protein